MVLKFIRKDFLRQKLITIALFVFIMLSAVLMASGANMLMDLTHSIRYFFEASHAPHFIQYHSGDMEQELIDRWSEEHQWVKQQETSEMINIDGSHIYFNNSQESQQNTLMEMGFVKQNEKFDYLLTLDNEKIQVKEGEMAVPIMYMQKNDLKLGDKVKITNTSEEMEFVITDFVRDVQMNPSIVSSKRFVVSDNDFEILKRDYGTIEHIISFQLNTIENLSEFANQYHLSNLPQTGPTIDYELLKLVNGLTDGLIAAVLIMIALLISSIALLCLRFTILWAIEEDYKDIGVMKGIGILPRDIKGFYLTKYFFLSLSASITGFVVSLLLNNLFSKNIRAYIGHVPKNLIQKAMPLLATLLIFAIVLSFCMVILRHFNKISVVEAINRNGLSNHKSHRKIFALHKSNKIHPSIFLGLRDVVLRCKTYLLLFFVFVLCILIIIVPLNFVNTVQSSDFMTYLGMGKSDLYIDLRQSEDVNERFEKMIQYIENDSDTVQYAGFITSTYEVFNKEGYKESLIVGVGDVSIFPLAYVEGKAPEGNNEIALSFLSAKALEKQIGNEITLMVEEKPRTMVVTGIYQDITNGGKTAKANITPNRKDALWYSIHVDINGDVTDKINEYGELFSGVSMTSITQYLEQTFAHTVHQLKNIIAIIIVLIVLVIIMITSLFFKLHVAKDLSQISVMRSIGIDLRQIQLQYITKVLVVLNLGIMVGTIMANTLGERLLSLVLSFIGASQFKFVSNPLIAYFIVPMGLMTVVTLTTLLSIASIKKHSITIQNLE
ncbi:putative ABC transport system permease protein [Natranaerovirga hydrolytica]|uniref:Putative ABC transport system permease protein n=1 Tax=Natranaerovirga hydrolytica TaxID=680378 RepID=A0A4R1MKR4_9FIRM|nr:ABC transporter permease [Natranaerovirga hydrolytica]TCK92640.1 putative ABC transport system permease protein [Natranaerovirga hydrolytica]